MKYKKGDTVWVKYHFDRYMKDLGYVGPAVIISADWLHPDNSQRMHPYTARLPIEVEGLGQIISLCDEEILYRLDE